MKKFSILIIIVLLHINSFANMKHHRDSLRTMVFFSQADLLGKDVIINGIIQSISASEILPENDISGIARDKTRATIRLYTDQSLRINDQLYVIDEKNLVVSRLVVKHLFSNRTFGNMALAYGNLKLAKEGFRVVQIHEHHNARWAFIHKARGDQLFRNGDRGGAISEYRKAIEMDPENPEARLGLGLIYYQDKIYNFAYSEFKKAYSSIQRLYDNEDRFILLSTLAELCFTEAYLNYNVLSNRERFRTEGMNFTREALKVNDRSAEMNFLLGEFFYRSFQKGEDNDRAARDSFLKTIALNPNHSMANLRLALLYIKHQNREKGLFYARKALESDPDNSEARELLGRYN